MKKLIYVLGVLVIALNLLFSVTLEKNITIDYANANIKDYCHTITDIQTDNWHSEILSQCTDKNGNYCGQSTNCAPGGDRCLFYQCDVIL